MQDKIVDMTAAIMQQNIQIGGLFHRGEGSGLGIGYDAGVGWRRNNLTNLDDV